MKIDQIVAKLAELETQLAARHEEIREQSKRISELETAMKKAADRRGPKSDREMTDDDARRIMGGDLEQKSHKDCAETLGLSYAQVYSARKGFTFKHIAKEVLEAKKKAASTPTETQQS